MPFLSVRMRASLLGRHVSGAERIISPEEIPPILCELIRRPKKYDAMKITIEKVSSVEVIRNSLKIRSYKFSSPEDGREFAVKELVKAGVPETVAQKGVELLKGGPGPGGRVMRGAVLLDINSGERLEPDRARGIRTTKIDWKDRESVRKKLLGAGFTERTLDALALATKNIHCGVLAELCWSDDPTYTAGYVAIPDRGYVRIDPLKHEGDPLGGRVYFILKDRLKEVMGCLQERAMLIDSLQL
ncbi:MAG TPA: 6-carboxyhexanoate--CoA ligase [Aquifex aeolicus]|nr:6-carboxyhexanoate--CoA ligase [Aquifex aeolicus]